MAAEASVWQLWQGSGHWPGGGRVSTGPLLIPELGVAQHLSEVALVPSVSPAHTSRAGSSGGPADQLVVSPPSVCIKKQNGTGVGIDQELKATKSYFSSKMAQPQVASR